MHNGRSLEAQMPSLRMCASSNAGQQLVPVIGAECRWLGVNGNSSPSPHPGPRHAGIIHTQVPLTCSNMQEGFTCILQAHTRLRGSQKRRVHVCQPVHQYRSRNGSTNAHYCRQAAAAHRQTFVNLLWASKGTEGALRSLRKGTFRT